MIIEPLELIKVLIKVCAVNWAWKLMAFTLSIPLLSVLLFTLSQKTIFAKTDDGKKHEYFLSMCTLLTFSDGYLSEPVHLFKQLTHWDI